MNRQRAALLGKVAPTLIAGVVALGVVVASVAGRSEPEEDGYVAGLQGVSPDIGNEATPGTLRVTPTPWTPPPTYPGSPSSTSADTPARSSAGLSATDDSRSAFEAHRALAGDPAPEAVALSPTTASSPRVLGVVQRPPAAPSSRGGDSGQPAPAIQQPAPTTQQPAPATQQPAPTTQQPAPTTQQPAPTTQQPAPTTQQPAPPDLDTPDPSSPPAVSAGNRPDDDDGQGRGRGRGRGGDDD